jgi:hypothetical protein
LYGDPSIKAGDALTMQIVNRDNNDYQTLNGSYLISSVKQSLVFDASYKLLTAVECLAGTYDGGIK